MYVVFQMNQEYSSMVKLKKTVEHENDGFLIPIGCSLNRLIAKEAVTERQDSEYLDKCSSPAERVYFIYQFILKIVECQCWSHYFKNWQKINDILINK